jgi:trans-aconitate 2-methyltransferase
MTNPADSAPARQESNRDWDATRYDRVSDPQVEWGRRVIARLAPQPRERLLDLGCGTARLTAELAGIVPDGLVVGLDPSEAMLGVASAAVRSARPFSSALVLVRGDGSALPFASSLDAVFSTATFHWIADHDTAFESVFAALRPGGRFVCQCGGGENLLRLYTRAADLMQSASFSRFFDGWRNPWHFAFPDETRAALERAGFVDVRVWLESTPAVFGDAASFSEFISCVCLRHHLARLPVELHGNFTAGLTRFAAIDDPPFTLDYWRLNIDAWRPSE